MAKNRAATLASLFSMRTPAIIVGALLLTPAVVIVGNRMVDPAALQRSAKAQELARVHESLDALGLTRSNGATADDPFEIWVATRPFDVSLAHGNVTGVAPNHGAEEAIAVVRAELAKYPASFLRAIHFDRVVLCADLMEGAEPIPSLPNWAGSLLLDVSAKPRFLSRILHHEVFHFVDAADDGKLADDPKWVALNDPGFSYGAGGRSMRAGWESEPGSGPPGFVTAYATSGPEEDKAEVFAFLVTDREGMRARISADPVLARKAQEIAARTSAIDDASVDARFLGLVDPRPPIP